LIEANRIAAADVGINNKNISEKALQVVADLQSAGFESYLVGGCVRDLLIGIKPKDFDIATNAKPDEIKRLFGGNARIIGRRFKIVHVRFGREVIEVATFRADASDRARVGRNEMSEGEQGQLLRDNVFGTIEEDVIRRDFTVNALYYDSVGKQVLDFVGGLEDIKNKQLKSIGEPEQRFTEDPVRMLRIIRFAAKLEFEMPEEALELIKEQGKLLSHVSNARLFEEVLKLFHGGAAYNTYLLLRKWGLFKYLFPFTDAMVEEGVEGLPERALQNTDTRVKAGKPVIPAFLFACMMWDPVRADAQTLMEDGANESHAWRVAMNDALRDQNQYVAVPKRLADIILDIWNIHFRLIKRNPRMVKACLNNRRFRAAYDFLLLRNELHEIEGDIAEWWTKIQEVDDAAKEQMIADVTESYRAERQARQQQHHQNEPDGNSIAYRQSQDNYGNDNYGNNDSYGNARANNSNRRGSRTHRTGGRQSNNRRSNNRQSNARNNAGGESHNSSGGAQNRNTNNRNRHRSKKANNFQKNNRSGGQRRHSGGQRTGGRYQSGGNDARYHDARPADEYAVTSNDRNKKVKIRRKRRVPGASDNGVDETPHF